MVSFWFSLEHHCKFILILFLFRLSWKKNYYYLNIWRKVNTISTMVFLSNRKWNQQLWPDWGRQVVSNHLQDILDLHCGKNITLLLMESNAIWGFGTQNAICLQPLATNIAEFTWIFKESVAFNWVSLFNPQTSFPIKLNILWTTE